MSGGTPIAARAVLLDQMASVTRDGAHVVVFQHWQGPAGDRAWLALSQDGRVLQTEVFSGGRLARLAGEWAEVRAALTADGRRLIEGAELDAELAARGYERRGCGRGDCDGVLPVGRPYCPACGRNALRVAAGSVLTSARRGPIFLDCRA